MTDSGWSIDGVPVPMGDDYIDGEQVEQIRLFDEGDGWVLDGANADGTKYSRDLFKYDTRDEALLHVDEFRDWLKQEGYNLAETLPVIEEWEDPDANQNHP